MARSITLHPVSLAAGVLLAGVTFIAMSQGTAPASKRIEYGPQPREFVQIREGMSLVVPAGRVFVPTAIGQDRFWPGNTMFGRLIVNGGEVCHTYIPNPQGSMVAITTGLAFPAGTVVEAAHAGSQLPGTLGQVWGYLSAAALPPGTGLPGIRVAFTGPACDYLSVPAGTTYVVPQGRLFVVTAVGDLTDIVVNGATVYTGGQTTTPITNTQAMPEGLVVPAGSSITAISQGGSLPFAQVWGYLGLQ